MYIYTDPICIAHEVPDGHPERADRLRALVNFFEESGITRDHPLRTPQPAPVAAVLRAHPQAHVDFLTSLSGDNLVPVDPDTWMGPHSLQAAYVAAGAVCDGVEALLQGDTNRVFCAVRPPGHHAEHAAAMGFCLFNSVAIGALQALAHAEVERVAILDFDVHHGNGTVDIFKDNPAVLVCSSFQHPHYPNRLFDIERPNIVNTPLPAGTGGDVFRRKIEADWLPALDAHQPQLILISAGFDAHQRDPLADLNLVEDDYAWITRVIVSAAERHADGRILSTLEGGYDLQALVGSVEAHLTNLT
jgi:acetoin utilization deacetylase AcuC-like enzyme